MTHIRTAFAYCVSSASLNIGTPSTEFLYASCACGHAGLSPGPDVNLPDDGMRASANGRVGAYFLSSIGPRRWLWIEVGRHREGGSPFTYMAHTGAHGMWKFS
eukprot:COSAG01_NODE_35483_length_531_cov_0.831019_2_plen_102_part_01